MQHVEPPEWINTLEPDDKVRRRVPRVAFLPDSFHEVNGVAHTARNFVAYAVRHQRPFLCIRAAAPGTLGGPVVHAAEGSVQALDLPRSRLSIRMERDLSFDPLFFRHLRVVEQAVRRFRPDVIHITGPSEMGVLGAYFAWRLRVALAAGWHTNVHEYAARRLGWLARLMPNSPRMIEAAALDATTRFYRLSSVIFAPNDDLCNLLQRRTGRPCHIMRRGVDAELFTPARRTRAPEDPELVIGYVGRLSVEKNIQLLPAVAEALRQAGVPDTRFVIIGHGEGEQTLREALPEASFPGVLRGTVLAQAYADMDLFVFPSETDTFGNVVLEALASGVPAAVTTGGGPKFIVEDGVTGVVRPADDLPDAIVRLLGDRPRLRSMGVAARASAVTYQWDSIFEGVYREYPGTKRAKA